MNKIGLVRDVKTLGPWQAQRVKSSTDKAHYAKQNIKSDDDA